MHIVPAASETGIVEVTMAVVEISAEVLRKALGTVGRIIALLLGFALVVGAVISLRFALYEYGHGNAALVRHVAGTLLSSLDQTRR